MGILKGKMSVTRYEAAALTAPGWREAARDAITSRRFMAPPTWRKEVVSGWCLIDSLLDTDFSDFNRWLHHDNSIALGLRIAAKKLPAADFKAELEKRCTAWRIERGVERAPSSIKKEIKERLEEDWLSCTVPTSKLVEVVWRLDGGFLLVGSVSPNVLDIVRKTFHRTFGVELLPDVPTDWVVSAATREKLIHTGPISIRDEDDLEDA